MVGQSCGVAPNCIQPFAVTCDDCQVVPLAKPIRIFQFLLVVALFAIAVYTIARNTPYKQEEAIILIAAYGSFLLIASVDIVSQFGGDPIPDTPMFLFGVIGTLLFLLAAFGIFFVTKRASISDTWRLTTTMVLSAAGALLYLLDVVLIFLYGY